jgi:hypothetical protein
MPILELETPEAKYINDMTGMGHFAIDCACKGKDGKYSGSHYKPEEDIDIFERTTEEYQSVRMNKYEHTFMLSQYLLVFELYEEHREEMKQSPLVIICNDCGREFSFTYESYFDLRDRMMSEYQKSRER